MLIVRISVISLSKQVGEKLGRMDVEKRQAVENEDYDQARLKKQQIDEYRLQIYKDLDLNDLLELPGVQSYFTFFHLNFIIVYT